MKRSFLSPAGFGRRLCRPFMENQAGRYIRGRRFTINHIDCAERERERDDGQISSKWLDSAGVYSTAYL
jgi:hypothetical protein